MPERYIVKNKDGKVVFDGMAKTENEAKAFAHQDHSNIPPDEMTAEIGEFIMPDIVRITSPDSQTGEASSVNIPLIRKARSDKGKSHGKKQEPGKKTRNRRQFFVVPDNTPIFNTRQDLNIYLDSLEKEIKVRVGQGHVFTPERKVQFALKAIKE